MVATKAKAAIKAVGTAMTASSACIVITPIIIHTISTIINTIVAALVNLVAVVIIVGLNAIVKVIADVMKTLFTVAVLLGFIVAIIDVIVKCFRCTKSPAALHLQGSIAAAS